jgi:hypothetical protein
LGTSKHLKGRRDLVKVPVPFSGFEVLGGEGVIGAGKSLFPSSRVLQFDESNSGRVSIQGRDWLCCINVSFPRVPFLIPDTMDVTKRDVLVSIQIAFLAATRQAVP